MRNCRWLPLAARLPLVAPQSARLALGLLAVVLTATAAPVQAGGSEAIGSEAVGSEAGGDPLVAGLALLSEGRYAEAAEALAALVAEQEQRADAGAADDERSIRALIGAGQSLRHLGKQAEALEFFEAAITRHTATPPNGGGQPDGVGQPNGMSRPGGVGRANPPGAAAGGPLDPLRLAAADCAFRTGAFEVAAAHCAAVLASTDQPSLRAAAERLAVRVKNEQGQCREAWERLEVLCRPPEVDRAAWADVALAIGLRALTQREPQTAADACRWFLDHAPADAGREVAVLGVAWAAAQGAESHARAAELLLEFVAEFPGSPNVPRALLVAAGCLRRSDQPAEASEVLQRLLAEHPQSSEAAAAIAQLAEWSPGAPLSEAALETIRQQLDRGEAIADAVLVEAIAASAGGNHPELWQAATDALLERPSSRGKVEQVLAVLGERGKPADAERLAAMILGGAADDAVEPAFEQAARWAAVHGRWSMLALAAEYMDAGTGSDASGSEMGGSEMRGSRAAEEDARWERFSPLSLRLLAEGLVQVGRSRKARPLLDRLVEVHQVSDFDVFVRRAEIALASDPRADARAAVEQAIAAVSTPGEQTLADILQAQLLIREARMDEARVLLEGIVRDGETSAEIKARAQWLMGETHFLQRRYREAVEAYRVVETFNGEGAWTAAALVQAGKAFEQLGRPRDAAICYSGLLRRFGDSPHAAAARDRLAAIGRSTELR
ncbi:tetratricopeptide repeat protein [Candidatus Laterigemmans baculatus]|uniref:tetratricopeptide repeat protein n=1 Tax=Candidatus Laterigemmans baculatus TaxID=2770505 RepID=UPI0013DA2274|nr:tetratricopeptide repeat protein [Candidatus Laterigemmans baculatus]